MKKFLIVVDMQKDFVDGALGTAEAVTIVDNVVRKIEKYGRPCKHGNEKHIIVTYDTHSEDYMETSEGKKLPVPHCIKGTDGHKLDAKVQTALEGKQYTEVEKLTFGSKDLPNVIAGLIKEGACADCVKDEDFEIELVGLCTDICVVSNTLLLKAHFPEKEITVDASCCAGVTPETHSAALATMKMCQINITNE